MVGTRARQLIIIDIDTPQPHGPGDPDDEQTLVRALLYANDIEIAGIVVNPTKAAARKATKFGSPAMPRRAV